MTELAPTPLASVSDLPARFAAIVGDKHVVTDLQDMALHLTEPRDLYTGKALCIVRPGSTAEVAAVLKICQETGTAVVPQGGNTGLVGGQIPDGSGAQIVLSLRRLDKIREVDVSSSTMTLEAGITLLRAQEIAREHDRLFPLSLAAEGSATIGGNLATNAGGTNAIVFGTARDLVLGLEVVLADGRILSNLGKLKKDNTGYDLKHLFMGAEGTLGIITAAVLKLFPQPRSVETAFIGLNDPDHALALLTLAQSMAGADVKTFELMPRVGIDMVLKHASGVREPLEGQHPWYVLLELSSQNESGLDETLMGIMETAFEKELIADAAIAASLDQRNAFWKLRELMSEMQKYEGGSIKHDVSVPVAKVPEFLAATGPAVEARIPGVRLVSFGHLGDGNIHYNISQPVGADKAAFLSRWYEVNDIVHEQVLRLGGSISAEHGIGIQKREELAKVKDPVALAVMRSIKASLDPRGIMNPGKVL